MTYYVYVLKSELNGILYIGFTSDLERRLKEHNSGKTKSLKPYLPYKIVYTEQFDTREKAVNREKYLKSGIGREFIKNTLKKYIELFNPLDKFRIPAGRQASGLNPFMSIPK